jgi:cyanophycin synthetase
LIVEGIEAGRAAGARCQSMEIVLDEMDATRHALDIGAAGDVVVVCVDHASDVWQELQRRHHGAATASAGHSTD